LKFDASSSVVKNWGTGVVHGVNVFNGGPVLKVEASIGPDSRQVFSKSFVAFALGNFASVVSSSWVTVNSSAGNRVVVFALVWVAIFAISTQTIEFDTFFASVQISAGSINIINCLTSSASFSGVVWEAVASVVSDHFGECGFIVNGIDSRDHDHIHDGGEFSALDDIGVVLGFGDQREDGNGSGYEFHVFDCWGWLICFVFC
jgi:hypothetical protein